ALPELNDAPCRLTEGLGDRGPRSDDQGRIEHVLAAESDPFALRPILELLATVLRGGPEGVQTGNRLTHHLDGAFLLGSDNEPVLALKIAGNPGVAEHPNLLAASLEGYPDFRKLARANPRPFETFRPIASPRLQAQVKRNADDAQEQKGAEAPFHRRT